MIILSGSGKHSFILIRKGWALSPKVPKTKFRMIQTKCLTALYLNYHPKSNQVKVFNLSIRNLYSCQKLPTNNCGSIITKPHRMASWISSLPASLKSGKASCEKSVRYGWPNCSVLLIQMRGSKKNKHLRKIHISHIFHISMIQCFLGGTPQNLKVWEKPEASVQFVGPHQVLRVQFVVGTRFGFNWGSTIATKVQFTADFGKISSLAYSSLYKKNVLSLTHTFTGLRCLVLCQFFTDSLSEDQSAPNLHRSGWVPHGTNQARLTRLGEPG